MSNLSYKEVELIHDARTRERRGETPTVVSEEDVDVLKGVLADALAEKGVRRADEMPISALAAQFTEGDDRDLADT